MVEPRSLRTAALLGGCLLLVVSLPVTGAASGVTLTVNAPSSATPGEEVVVRIDVDAEAPIYGIQYTLSFDADTVSVQRVEQGTFFTDEGASLLLAKDVDESAGQMEYGETRQSADSGITGEGTVTRITFVVDENPQDEEVRFALNEVKASDPDGQPIETSTQSATVVIAGSDSTSTAADQSAATDTEQSTASGESTVEPWREKLTATLEEEVGGSNVVPVIVVVAESADLESVADSLNQQGATEVEALASIHAVAAVVDEDTLAETAKRDDVERIRYDSRVDVNDTGTPTKVTETKTVTTDISTEQPTDSATSTMSAGQPPSDDTETSRSADGFGILSAVVGTILLVFHIARNRRKE